jgi:hypothetical protein
MIHRISTVLFLAAALAGCIVTQPSTTPATSPDIGRDDMGQARRACVAEARQQGMKVRGVEQTAYLGGTRYQVRMRTGGQYGPEQISCVYNARNGVARIEGQPELDPNILAQARFACIAEAQRQGRNVLGVDRTKDLGDMRYQVTLRTMAPYGQAPLTCIYNAQFRAARIQ